MKKIKLFLLSALCLAVLLLLSACGDAEDATTQQGGLVPPAPDHTHAYTIKQPGVPESLVSEPTCTDGGVYRYICSCGAIGTETYTVGSYGHDFSRHDVSEALLASPATCRHAAAYYSTCSRCGEVSDEVTFQNGLPAEHRYEDNLCIYGCGDELNLYRLSEDGDYYILTAFREQVGETVTVPATYKGLPVAAIGSGVLQISGVREVILPESVKTVEANAFYGYGTLARINLDKVEVIGDGAFVACEALTEVNLAALTAVGENAFSQTGILSLTLGERLTSVGNGAFSYCESLREVTLNAPALPDLSYPSSVFAGSGAPFALMVGETTTYIPAAFFSSARISSITFDEDGAYTIGREAFRAVTGLTTLTLTRVSDVREDAFYDNADLSVLHLGGLLNTVGDQAFASCGNLAEVTMDVNRGGYGTFLFANSLPGLTLYYNHEGSETLGDALAGAGHVQLVLGANVRTVPERFAYGAPLATLRFAAGAANVTIGAKAFFAVPLYGDLDLSPVVSLGDCAFYSPASELACVMLGAGLTTVGQEIFDNVRELWLRGDACAGVPAAEGDALTLGIADAVAILRIGEGVTAIPPRLFGGAEIGAIVFDGTARCAAIGEEAFRYATIGTLSLPASLTTVGARAFDGATILTAPVSLGQVTTFGDAAFRHCEGTLVLDGCRATAIGEETFLGSGLTGSIVLLETATVGKSAFRDCGGITALTLGGVLSHIGEDAFRGCTGIASVRWDVVNAADLDGAIFSNQSGERGFTLTIGADVRRIPAHAFSHSAVVAVVIEDEGALTEIGEGAFAYTDRMDGVDLVLPESVRKIGARAFVLSTVHTVTLGTEIQEIGTDAFVSMGVIGETELGKLVGIYLTVNLSFTDTAADGTIVTVMLLAGNDEGIARKNAVLLYRAGHTYSKV